MNARDGDLLDRALVPELDDDGILRLGDAWVALSPIETRLARAFLDDPGRLLGRKTLGNAGWPDGVPNDRSVDSRIKTPRQLPDGGHRCVDVRGVEPGARERDDAEHGEADADDE